MGEQRWPGLLFPAGQAEVSVATSSRTLGGGWAIASGLLQPSPTALLNFMGNFFISRKLPQNLFQSCCDKRVEAASQLQMHSIELWNAVLWKWWPRAGRWSNWRQFNLNTASCYIARTQDRAVLKGRGKGHIAGVSWRTSWFSPSQHFGIPTITPTAQTAPGGCREKALCPCNGSSTIPNAMFQNALSTQSCRLWFLGSEYVQQTTSRGHRSTPQLHTTDCTTTAGEATCRFNVLHDAASNSTGASGISSFYFHNMFNTRRSATQFDCARL